jgi:YfiR/HmsC-like
MNEDTNQHQAAALPPGWLRRRDWLGVVARCVVLGLLLAPDGARAADSATALEYKVKSGYLLNFARYIEWPAACLPAPDSPFVIGVLDGGEALPVVKTLLEGKKVDSHPVQVKAVTADQIGKDIHILLVTRAAGKSPEEIRAALGDAATLLVGETEQFAERGGTVGFTREEESIRLSLNLERATEAGLKVSAKLASVAKQVKTKKK